MDDMVSRQAVIDALNKMKIYRPLDSDRYVISDCLNKIVDLPSAQPEEVIPHRNYKYLSDYWCECGWHLGKKGEVKYCSECGRKVNWDG